MVWLFIVFNNDDKLYISSYPAQKRVQKLFLLFSPVNFATKLSQ